MVLRPTCKAVSHPAILPSFNKFCLQLTNFLAIYKSPQFKAQLNEDKNCYYPRFFKFFIT